MNVGCCVCLHPQAAEINAEIARGVKQRPIAQRYGWNASTITRHIQTCIPRQLQILSASREERGALAVEREIATSFARINKLLDGCHAWLLDPDGSGNYTLEPRSREVSVVYEDKQDRDERGKPRRKKATLQDLLNRVESDGEISVQYTESKHADPRELILKTAAEIRQTLEFYAKLHGLFQKERSNVYDEEVKRRWVQDKIAETALRLNLPPAQAKLWLQENFPHVPEFAEARIDQPRYGLPEYRM